MKLPSIGYTIIFLFLISCTKKASQTDPVPQDSEYYLSGGEATTHDASLNAFGNQFKNVTQTEITRFETGNSFFRSAWVTAPSSTTARDGLGPFINANSCSSCHGSDGRGKPELDKGLLLRLSVDGTGIHGEPKGDSIYGGQLSTSAILGVQKEGDVMVSYSEMQGAYTDGSLYSLRKPIYIFTNLNYGDFESSSKFSPRVGQQVYGLGLLEIIPESTILQNEDIMDANGDGVSGKANRVWNKRTNKLELGRFGWKANQPDLFQQTSDAFNGDMGITSNLNPTQNLSGRVQKSLYGSIPSGGEPEIEIQTLEDVVFYLQSLAVPARRKYNEKDVILGNKLFLETGCGKCHIQKFQTGSSSVKQLSNQTITPYSDLLLHDMGEELSDGRPDFEANGNEWRTQPLWGIGLINTVNKHTFLLHDGRARNIEEAILWHGGEAENIKNKFKSLSKQERDAILTFLNNL